MDNRPPKLWDQNYQEPQGLRLPNTPLLPNDGNKTDTRMRQTTETDRTKLNNVTAPITSENKAMNSRLSAEAPEWYPSNYMNMNNISNTCNNIAPAKSSIQNRLKKHKIPEAEIIQPVQSSRSYNTMEVHNDFMGNMQDSLRLRHVINTLTNDPGQFDQLSSIFMDTLLPYFEDVIVLSNTAQLLVDQAISNPSFRYSAARICCSIEQQCPNFRAELHLTCKKEFDRNANKSGLLLFVAELYTQLHHDNIYGTYLIDAFKQLLDIGGNNNIKCICQALKLTGSSLELYNKSALDGVFAKLYDAKPTVTGTALSLIDSVINLRKSEWGHMGSNNTNNQNLEHTQIVEWEDTSNTVFYNPDGLKLSAEERQFLAAHLHPPDEYFLDTSDPDELYDPEPEMDEEIQAAFKDFVKLSKR